MYECLHDLRSSVFLYLDELSRVFFLKDNMCGKKVWWLSAFYSFCIQSFVRKALIELEEGILTSPYPAGRDYLRLPVRLFAAASGSFDPLGDTPGNPARDEPSIDDYQKAKVAVGHSHWLGGGIKGPGDYLKRLFEDSGKPLEPTPATDNLRDFTGRRQPGGRAEESSDLGMSVDIPLDIWMD